jgi:hypothetical protein
VVLSFSKLEGTYPVGAHSIKAQHLSIKKGDCATLKLNEVEIEKNPMVRSTLLSPLL